MIDPKIEKINTEKKIKSLERKVTQLDKLLKWGSAAVSFIVLIAGFFGFNAWSSISAKIDELNKNAEKVEKKTCFCERKFASVNVIKTFCFAADHRYRKCLLAIFPTEYALCACSGNRGGNVQM